MINWIDIKKRILFSYMGCDWTSIKIKDLNGSKIKSKLEGYISQTNRHDVYSFRLADVDVFFYLATDQHFDFDPKQIGNEPQWNKFLDFFKSLSKELNTEIQFRPEDSDFESESSILIKVNGDKVVYDFNVEAGYSDDEIYRN